MNEIDEKIKLLIKNRLSVQEVFASSSVVSGAGVSEGKDSAGDDLFKARRAAYEDLFYMLQNKPKYFAGMARLVQAKDISVFVQTVVFDMYGDQYDTREERLLLQIFRLVLKAELDACTDKGSLLRANTAITQMLSAYARRGQGLSILRDVLEEPLQFITNQKDLNLEINPSKVFSQLVTDHETSSGTPWDGPRELPDDEAIKHPLVRPIISERSKTLIGFVDTILERIVSRVDLIPYGMRWICKQLGVLAKQRFPDVDRSQLGSLMGGYIYLRFFNPVIVTPDAINFIQTKPKGTMRRNLILIAKVLQNLSNGLGFGDKEMYMRDLNPYLESKREVLQEYFRKLAAVDDLEDALQVDKYLEHASGRLNAVQLTLNQMALVHQLAFQHQAILASEAEDPLRPILKALGTPPASVPISQNRTVSLQLIDRRSTRLSTAVDLAGQQAPQMNPMYLEAKKLLLSALRRLPSTQPGPESHGKLMNFLAEARARALARSDSGAADALGNVASMLKTLHAMGLLQMHAEPAQDVFNNFLWSFAKESLSRRQRIKDAEKRLELVAKATESINAHHQYLLQRLELYKQYLENVRKGQAQQEIKSSKPKKEKEKVLKFTHSQLEDMGVICKTNPDVKGILKKCQYTFSRADQPGKFKVELQLKKGITFSLLNKPIELVLDELLRMQEHSESNLSMEGYISLNVNLLIHLFNTHFLSDKK